MKFKPLFIFLLLISSILLINAVPQDSTPPLYHKINATGNVTNVTNNYYNVTQNITNNITNNFTVENSSIWHNELYELQGGNTSEYYHLNQTVWDRVMNYFMSWITGADVPSYEEDPLSIHKDGSRELTGNWDQSSFNLTNLSSWFLGHTNWSKVIGRITNLSQLIDDILWTASFNSTYDSRGLGVGFNSTYNSTYDAYNSTGLIRDWNSTHLIIDWNNTGYIINWNSSGLIINWSNAITFPSYYFSNLTNFTSQLDNNGLCFYNSTSDLLNCSINTGSFLTTSTIFGGLPASDVFGDYNNLQVKNFSLLLDVANITNFPTHLSNFTDDINYLTKNVNSSLFSNYSNYADCWYDNDFSVWICSTNDYLGMEINGNLNVTSINLTDKITNEAAKIQFYYDENNQRLQVGSLPAFKSGLVATGVNVYGENSCYDIINGSGQSTCLGNNIAKNDTLLVDSLLMADNILPKALSVTSSVLVGAGAGFNANTSESDTIIGSGAFVNADSFNNTVGIGAFTGQLLTGDVSHLLLLGANSGPATPGAYSYEGYIDVQQSDTPLIFLDFLLDYVQFWGDTKQPDDFKAYQGSSDDVYNTFDSGLLRWLFNGGNFNTTFTGSNDLTTLVLEDGYTTWNEIYNGCEGEQWTNTLTDWLKGNIFINDNPFRTPPSTGVYQCQWEGVEDDLDSFGNFDFPKDYIQDTDFDSYIKWSSLTNAPCNVVFEEEYQYNIPGLPWATTIITNSVLTTTGSGGGVMDFEPIHRFGLKPGVGQTIDTEYVYRISLLGTDPRTTCAFEGGQVYLHGYGLEYEQNTLGATNQLTKW